jgi:hypothetical protein
MNLRSKSLTAFALSVLSLQCSQALAAFEESNVPIAVKTLYCDASPRILVQFADPSKNVWYPANAADQSKAFLAIALAAKASGQKLYYYGTGDPTVLTSYCVGVSARRVDMFGLE